MRERNLHLIQNATDGRWRASFTGSPIVAVGEGDGETEALKNLAANLQQACDVALERLSDIHDRSRP